MKIRCENCQSDFFVTIPASGELPLFTTCTHCEYPNPVPGGGRELEQSSEVYTQCFNCGRQMAHNAELAIPICSNCQEGEEKAVSVKEWMVKKVSGQIYGPFDLETLQAWIEAAKMEPADEVAKVGGQWKKFEQHALFSRFFSGLPQAGAGDGGSEVVAMTPTPHVAPEVEKKKKRKLSIDWRYVGLNIIALLGTALAIGGAYIVLDRQWLVVPEDWVNAADDFISEEILARLENNNKGESLAAVKFGEVLDSLREEHPNVSEPSTTLFARGRTFFLQDTAASLRRARSELEKAVLANPKDVLALAALAEVYSVSGDTALQEQAARFVDEAARLSKRSAEVHRARAAFLIATLHLDEARKEAKSCLQVNSKDGEAAYYIGMSHLKPLRPENEEALKYLIKAVELNPRLHKAHHQLGIVYLNLGEYRKAHQSLETKLKLDASNARALADMGRLYEEVGDNRHAIDYYRRAYRISGSEDARIAMDLAVLSYQGWGRFFEAREILSKIVPDDGKPPRISFRLAKEVLTHLAAVERELGNYKQSLRASERVLEIDPNFAPALFQRGLTFLAMGKGDDAGLVLRKASTLVKENDARATVRFYLGELALKQDKVRDAVDEFSGAVDAFRQDLRSSLALVDTHLKLGQINEALTAAREVMPEDPTYMSQRALRTLYYCNTNDFKPDVDRFRKLAEEKFYQADPSVALAMLLVHLNRNGAAIQVFRKTLGIDAGSAGALLNLGIFAFYERDYRTATSFLRKLLDADAQFGVGYIYLGRALTMIGSYDEAEAAFKKAERYARTNPQLYDASGVLNVKMGRLKKARQDFLKSIELDGKYLQPRRHLFSSIP